jgi:hypothetical protein
LIRNFSPKIQRIKIIDLQKTFHITHHAKKRNPKIDYTKSTKEKLKKENKGTHSKNVVGELKNLCLSIQFTSHVVFIYSTDKMFKNKLAKIKGTCRFWFLKDR